MAPPFAAAAVSSHPSLFSPSTSRPAIRRHLPPSSISVRPRRCPPAASAAAAEPAGKLLLEVHGLTASVKETGQQILKGVDLTIREGEVRGVPRLCGAAIVSGSLA
jgi:Fe-S cluster assembly ATP-binding protein